MNKFSRISQQAAIAMLVILALLLPSAPAQAEGDTPNAGGIFRVYLGQDNTNAGNWLSLREAILLANGGTGPGGLNRPLEIDEVIDIEGCNFGIDGGSGKAVIVGGCGKGVPDTILLYGGQTGETVGFRVDSALPAINDSQPTILSGEASSQPVVLDFAQNSNTQGLTIKSNNNVLRDITIRNGRCPSGGYCPALYALGLMGNNNLATNVSIFNMQGQGIVVEGDGNKIDAVHIGVPAGNIAICPPALPGIKTGILGTGVRFAATGQNNKLSNSVIGCNADDGVYVEAGAAGTVIGPANRIGTTTPLAGTVTGNSSYGIQLGPNVQGVTIISNTVAYNGETGILLFGSSNNVLGGNLVRGNGEDGILVLDAANNNRIGGPAPGNPYGGNKVVKNKRHGIHLLAVAGIPAGNQLAGNWVGLANATDMAGNGGSGVVLDGAQETKLGVPDPAASNLIGGNLAEGVWLLGAAHDNQLVNNLIGTNGFTALPNGKNGLLIEAGSHHNLIGAVAISAANLINSNTDSGVLLRGAGTVANNLLNNTIAWNGLDGVQLAAQANNNNVGGAGIFVSAGNLIHSNGRSGVRLAEGAHHNGIGGNWINKNAGAGIHFVGAGTQHNSVTSARSYANKGSTGDGIAEGNGADHNFWSRISTYDNSGLGIDVAATDGSNDLTAPYPTITGIAPAAGKLTISGHGAASLINEQTTTIEIYQVAPDASGHGEGQTFVTSGQTNADGDFELVVDSITGCFTAFQSVSTGSAKDSSEFGPNFCAGMPQTIAFAAIPNKLAGDPAFAVNATASSGLPVSLQAAGPCTVAQQTISLTGAGTCVLTAQQAGNASYAPAPDVVVQFEILKQAQSITWGEDGTSQVQFTTAKPFALNANASSGLPVTFVAQGVCTVAGNVVTLTGAPGLCDLAAQQPGDAMYYPAPEAVRDFEVLLPALYLPLVRR